jgi:hypothetical protein
VSTQPDTVPDEDTLRAWAVTFLNALLSSANASVLGRWYWDRARSALETGTATASYGEAVSRTAAKLTITGALQPRTVPVITGLAAGLSSPAVFGAWAELCRRDAVYICALARIARDEAREDRGQETAS